MGKVFKDGNWVLTRDAAEADSDRHTERDDPLFESLQSVFLGEEQNLDLEKIAAAKGLKPEDVFMDLHENYGYICIGTGENPAAGETLSDEEKLQRQLDIQRMLAAEKLPHVLIKGKYMGVSENSYFIPFNNKVIGLANVLQSDMVKKVEAIAHRHNQDSLLITQNGYACYLYTSGSQKGNVITGRSAVVYPREEQLPEDCYTLFINSDNVGTVGFTCGLNFSRVYANVEEYAAEENNTLQHHYTDFITQRVEPAAHGSNKKIHVMLRGTDGYNAYAIELMRALQQAGLKAAIFGSDANIAKVNEEVAADNKVGGPKAGWTWPQIRGEFLKRNLDIYHSLLASDVDVIVYADMNKLVQFMEPYISAAVQCKYPVVSQVVNSFVFEPGRSNYVKKLCQQFGDYMGRHVVDFTSEASQINAKQVRSGEFVVDQFHSLPVQDFVRKICASLGREQDLKAERDLNSAAVAMSGAVPTMFPRPAVQAEGRGLGEGQAALENSGSTLSKSL